MLVAVDKWRHFLERNKFVIKTDHESEIFVTIKVAYAVATKGHDKADGLGLCNPI